MYNYDVLLPSIVIFLCFFQMTPFLRVRAGTLANIQTEEYTKSVIRLWDEFRLKFLGSGDVPQFLHIDSFVKTKLKQGLAPTTLESQMSMLNKALNWFFAISLKVWQFDLANSIRFYMSHSSE